jgi:hypothetical protein
MDKIDLEIIISVVTFISTVVTLIVLIYTTYFRESALDIDRYSKVYFPLNKKARNILINGALIDDDEILIIDSMFKNDSIEYLIDQKLRRKYEKLKTKQGYKSIRDFSLYVILEYNRLCNVFKMKHDNIIKILYSTYKPNILKIVKPLLIYLLGGLDLALKIILITIVVAFGITLLLQIVFAFFP